MTNWAVELVVVGDGAQSRYVDDIRGGLPLVVVVPFGTAPADIVAYGVVVVVCHHDPRTKRDKARLIVGAGGELAPGIIHRRATVSRTAKVQPGAIINAGAVVQPGSTIGPGVMIHANVTVEHDANLLAYVNVAPGAVICGGVVIGTGAYIGAGAIILPNKTVGAFATVGAGAVVLDDVPHEITVVGVPAREVSRV